MFFVLYYEAAMTCKSIFSYVFVLYFEAAMTCKSIFSCVFCSVHVLTIGNQVVAFKINLLYSQVY